MYYVASLSITNHYKLLEMFLQLKLFLEKVDLYDSLWLIGFVFELSGFEHQGVISVSVKLYVAWVISLSLFSKTTDEICQYNLHDYHHFLNNLHHLC